MDTKTPIDTVEVIAQVQPGRKRRFTAAEKQRLLEEAQLPGSSLSEVARRYKVSPSLMFRWRRLAEEGTLKTLDADESVVPASEARQLRQQIRTLERMLGRATMKIEILEEATKLSRSKKLLLRSSWPDDGDGL